MGIGTICTGKKVPIYGHGDTLHWQKAPHIWAWGHLAMAKEPAYMRTGILCSGKKAPMSGDTLQCEKGLHIWAW